GGTANDLVTAATGFLAGNAADLGTGTDTLILNGATNTLTVSNIETINGGTANDLATATTGLVDGTADNRRTRTQPLLPDAHNHPAHPSPRQPAFAFEHRDEHGLVRQRPRHGGDAVARRRRGGSWHRHGHADPERRHQHADRFEHRDDHRRHRQ